MSGHLSFADYAHALDEFIQRCSCHPPLSSDVAETETEFNRLALTLFGLQVAHNAPYARFCRARGTGPDRAAGWQDIPAMPVVGFKELELTCLPPDQRLTVFHSSGTTRENSSRHFHNRESLAVYEASLLPWFKAHVVPDLSPAWRGCFLSLTPGPAQAPHSSLVRMFDTLRREFSGKDFVFAGQAGAASAWDVEFHRACGVLGDAVAEGLPVVLLGAAFSFVHLTEHLAKEKTRFALPQGSRLMETGGYKGRSRALPKEELHEQLGWFLGLASSQIICEYGMSELSSQAYDRVYGHPLIPSCQTLTTPVLSNPAGAGGLFRFPSWVRARIISPEHAREVEEGETGLVQVFDLANAFSVLAVQTEDLAVRRTGGFELLGRSPQAPARGCSLMLSEENPPRGFPLPRPLSKGSP